MLKKLVVLGIAHHPASPGAGYNGIYEHEISARWSHCLKNQLELLGVDCAILPVGRLKGKVKSINRMDADACVEIHFNGAYDPSIAGCETLYCPGSTNGHNFAKSVHDRYHNSMSNRNRGIKEGWYRMDRPGFEDYPGDVDGDERKDYFLQYTNCPALILEPDFISQIKNISMNMENACFKIALGIDEYLRTT